MKGYSLIVCTHNPDKQLFSAVTDRLLSLLNSRPNIELLIIDNNSTKSLSEDLELKDKFTKVSNYKLIPEKNPGLTHARITGFLNAKYDWLVFVDDDNLPAPDYIDVLQYLEENIPEVNCWGAGEIEVYYTDEKENSFLKSIKYLFQERYFEGVNYSCNIAGEEFYPPGSCMCVNKQVFKRYYDLFKEGRISAVDRVGRSLNSAGDTQIVYTSIKNKFFVGSSGQLKIRHLINKRKTTISYLLKLVYALHSGHIKAYNEVFFDSPLLIHKVTSGKIFKSIYSHLRNTNIFPLKKNLLKLSNLMGNYNAHLLPGNLPKPFILRLFEKVINVF